MKQIIYKTLQELPSLQEDWERLEKGSDMTYFQTYSWYIMLKNIFEDKFSDLEIVFVLISNKGIITLIAPFVIYRQTKRLINRKGIYFFGRKGWSDYLNIIYDHFLSEDVDALLLDVKKKYGINTFFFEQIKENTMLYKYFKGKGVIQKDISYQSFGLEMPPSISDYHHLLSKHARQNIRTAQNRICKNGIAMHFIFDDKNVDKMECIRMRENRVVTKEKRNIKQSFINGIKNFARRRLIDKYPDYIPLIEDPQSKIFTAYIGDKLCAFLNYGIDIKHKSIVLMAVGIDNDYAKYSPGILSLYSFICSCIKENKVEYFDFTRGNESYKVVLGGKESLIHNIILVVE